MQPEQPQGTQTVPFARVGTFVRQLTHDIRNGLNALDLQSAFIAELVTDPEASDELKKLRAMVTNLAKTLGSVSSFFQTVPPSLIPYQASIFLEDFRDRLARVYPEKTQKVEWKIDLADQEISVDVEQIISALMELFKNAYQFQPPDTPIRCEAKIANGRFQLELVEAKTVDPLVVDSWGREPLHSTRRGGYGVGLYHARQIVEAHGGDLNFEANPEELRVRLTLPLS